MKYKNIREEELKNKVGADWFIQFDTTEIIGNIDFTVFPKQDNLFGRIPLLWAEAKTGNFDVPSMFVQLILTIGKARTFDKTLPPAFLGAFDFKKMAFVPYINVQDIFYLNDFNWNVAPSNHETKEFKLIKERIEAILTQNTYVYDFEKDDKDLATFIKNNVAKATTASKLKIDKNNFIPIYLRWLDIVKPIIDVNWDQLKKANIFDNDFYLADLFVDDKDTENIDDDFTPHDSLFVIVQNQGYKLAKENIKQMFEGTIHIRSKETYQQFWKLYKRSTIKEFQDYIIEHRDLLVPQDIRERKGAFFTPRKWVELSQKYLTDYLGENWQDDYYIWDCAAGTGNLLAGLTNKCNIYASTLDQADVNVMHERIDHGANLLKSHVFQFDFLNDGLFLSEAALSEGQISKLPQSLQNIVKDEEKRKKLVIYINPPYAEAASAKTVFGTGENKANTAIGNKTYDKYKGIIGKASNELFTQFLARIYGEIPNCKIANFSTLKNLQSSNFKDFRQFFQAKLDKIFIVPADTFDNVKGKFPIGFFIWDLQKNEVFKEISADIFDHKAQFIGQKNIINFDYLKYINSWYSTFYDKNSAEIGVMNTRGNDFQNQNYIRISTDNNFNHTNIVTINNLITSSIYIAVRHCIKATWLNDRDQFLFPNNGWQTDNDFQNDCLAYTLFDNSNNITAKDAINHWIPFTEQEVNAKEKFTSNFMTDFIKGKIKTEKSTVINQDLILLAAAPTPGPTLSGFQTLSGFPTLSGFQTLKELNPPEELNTGNELPLKPLQFSPEATAVFDAGRNLWIYYHAQQFPSFGGVAESRVGFNVNASLYDIREFFQGRNEKGRMNARSTDQKYTQLISELRTKLGLLSEKIKPKIYEYEFLKA
jgi:hypothetical protein